MDFSQYEQVRTTKLLVFGPPKSGKTALVGKLAAHFKLHWVDLENGIKTLLNPKMLDPKYRSNINLVNVPDHRHNPVGIETVRKILKGGNQHICFDHGKANCPLCAKRADAKWSDVNVLNMGPDEILVIDSLSQVSSSALSRVTLKAISKPGGEEYKPTWDDYAAQGALMHEVLSLIQVLNTNIICISHELDTESLTGKAKIVPVAGTRNASLVAAKYFDEVVYTTVLNKKHRAFNSSTYDPTIVTGGRFGVSLDEQKEDELSLLPLFTRG